MKTPTLIAVLIAICLLLCGCNYAPMSFGNTSGPVAYPSDPTDAAITARYPEGVWKPTGQLASIPVIANCQMTGGDIAVARSDPYRGPVIIYCPQTAAQLNRIHPGAGHFYFVHEFAHHALATSDERACDSWAARQLAGRPNGDAFLRQAMRHFMSRGQEFHPRYGTMWSRAENISRSARIPMPGTQVRESPLRQPPLGEIAY